MKTGKILKRKIRKQNKRNTTEGQDRKLSGDWMSARHTTVSLYPSLDSSPCKSHPSSVTHSPLLGLTTKEEGPQGAEAPGSLAWEVHPSVVKLYPTVCQMTSRSPPCLPTDVRRSGAAYQRMHISRTSCRVPLHSLSTLWGKPTVSPVWLPAHPLHVTLVPRAANTSPSSVRVEGKTEEKSDWYME